MKFLLIVALFVQCVFGQLSSFVNVEDVLRLKSEFETMTKNLGSLKSLHYASSFLKIAGGDSRNSCKNAIFSPDRKTSSAPMLYDIENIYHWLSVNNASSCDMKLLPSSLVIIEAAKGSKDDKLYAYGMICAILSGEKVDVSLALETIRSKVTSGKTNYFAMSSQSKIAPSSWMDMPALYAELLSTLSSLSSEMKSADIDNKKQILDALTAYLPTGGDVEDTKQPIDSVIGVNPTIITNLKASSEGSIKISNRQITESSIILLKQLQTAITSIQAGIGNSETIESVFVNYAALKTINSIKFFPIAANYYPKSQSIDIVDVFGNSLIQNQQIESVGIKNRKLDLTTSSLYQIAPNELSPSIQLSVNLMSRTKPVALILDIPITSSSSSSSSITLVKADINTVSSNRKKSSIISAKLSLEGSLSSSLSSAFNPTINDQTFELVALAIKRRQTLSNPAILSSSTLESLTISFHLNNAGNGSIVANLWLVLASCGSFACQHPVDVQIPATLVTTAVGHFEYSVTISLADEDTVKSLLNGRYSLTILTGSMTTSGQAFFVGYIDVTDLPPSAKKTWPLYARALMYESDVTLSPLRELHHTFRPDEDRPAVWISIVFTVLVAVPLFWLLTRLSTMNMTSSTIDSDRLACKQSLLFYGFVLAFIAVLVRYWLLGNVFQTVNYLVLVGIGLAIAGKK